MVNWKPPRLLYNMSEKDLADQCFPETWNLCRPNMLSGYIRIHTCLCLSDLWLTTGNHLRYFGKSETDFKNYGSDLWLTIGDHLRYSTSPKKNFENTFLICGSLESPQIFYGQSKNDFDITFLNCGWQLGTTSGFQRKERKALKLCFWFVNYAFYVSGKSEKDFKITFLICG